MNCLPNISIALALLSLTAGMWLLYKSQKENLNTPFKVIGWFIVVVSFLLIICCGMRCMMNCCMSRGDCGGNSQCEMGGGGCEMRGEGCMKEKRIVMFRGGEDECEKKGKSCCKEGKSECEDEGEKDSVVVKK